jgi:transcriptional regulator with XRE-family HTH domain
MSWGALLKTIREGTVGLSQDRVARAAGLSQDRLSRIERGADLGLREAFALRDVLLPGAPLEAVQQLVNELGPTPGYSDRLGWHELRLWQMAARDRAMVLVNTTRHAAEDLAEEEADRKLDRAARVVFERERDLYRAAVRRLAVAVASAGAEDLVEMMTAEEADDVASIVIARLGRHAPDAEPREAPAPGSSRRSRCIAP